MIIPVIAIEYVKSCLESRYKSWCSVYKYKPLLCFSIEIE